MKNDPEPTPTTPRTALRMLVRGHYDLQKLRIQIGNRIVGNYKVRLGQEPGTKEKDTVDPEAQRILDDMRREYQRITDAVLLHPRRLQSFLTHNPLITSETEFKLVESYVYTRRAEETVNEAILREVQRWPIYEWLGSVRGVGHLMAAVLLAEIDIHKAKYVSSLWMYAGLDVAKDGLGRSRRQAHLRKVAYTDRYGEETERNSITFDPFLKTKLVGVLAGSFLRCESPYRKIYDDYKTRLENSPAHAEKPKNHRHRMALRYMMKMFLKDLYVEWKTVENLPVYPPYSEGKLGMEPHGGNGGQP